MKKTLWNLILSSLFSNMKSFYFVVENREKKDWNRKVFFKTKPDKKVERKRPNLFLFLSRQSKFDFFFNKTKQNEKDDAFKHSRLFEIWIQAFFWDRFFSVCLFVTQTSVIFLFHFDRWKMAWFFILVFLYLKSLYSMILLFAPSHFLHDKPASNILVVVRK